MDARERMLGINVSQLLKAPVGSTQRYEVEEPTDIAGSENKVKGEIELVRTGHGILARGVLDTVVDAICGRCLGEFDCPLVLEIEEEYFPTTDIVSGAPVPMPDESGYFTIDEHSILDLTEAIHQNLLLAIPMKQLCREDCAGLCPDCGHNLNDEPCDCPPREAGSRWSKLSELISDNGK